eukprot:1621435-Pleurochrysis_carterae.AAC.1
MRFVASTCDETLTLQREAEPTLGRLDIPSRPHFIASSFSLDRKRPSDNDRSNAARRSLACHPGHSRCVSQSTRSTVLTATAPKSALYA